MELFAFQAGKQVLGIPPREVIRVVENVPITPVPLMPPCYLGLIYHRGEVFDVVDVNCLLYLGTAVARNRPRIILTKWSSRRLALVPDRILGLVWPASEAGNHTGSPAATQPQSQAPPVPMPEAEAPPRPLSLDVLWESIEAQFDGSDEIL